jgi:hypothetical protein
MDPRVYPGSHTAGNGAHQQLHHLCRKMLEHGVDAKDPHLAPIIEEKVKAKLTTSKLLLNKSQSAHEDATIHEFSGAEKIKKYLVKDGRDKDTVKFDELHLRLQKSSIIKNRDAILSLFLNLAEKTNKNSVRKIPTFYLSNTENFGSSSSLNGSEPKRAGQQKSVVSISGTGNVDTYLTKVIPAPYPTKHRANGNDVNPAASNNSSNLRSPGYPPIGPKPIVKSPHGPSPPRGIHKLQQYEDKTVRQNDVLDSNLDQHGVRKENIGSVYPGRDDLDGIDGGVCSTELESRILRELIYAFQGIEGVMIRRKVKSRPERSSTIRYKCIRRRF